MGHNQIAALCLIITVISFLGFWVENVWLAVTKGFMDNRNMCLPFLIGYGFAIAVIYLLFGTPDELRFLSISLNIKNRKLRSFTYFLIVSCCISLGEVIIGTMMEKICGIVWWDYSWLPLHITRYTSVPTTVAFGSIITLFMSHLFAPLYHLFLQIPDFWLRIVSRMFMLLMVGDYTFSMVKMCRSGTLQQHWRIDTACLVFRKI